MNPSEIRKLILGALMASTLLIASIAHSAPDQCSAIFSSEDAQHFAVSEHDIATLPSSKTGLKDITVMLLPKIGIPSYHGPDYDISLLGTAKSSPIKPSLVLERARETFDSYFAQLAAWGHKPKERVHFVIELTPGSLGGRDGLLGYLPQPIAGRGLFTGSEAIGIKIQGLFGIRRRLKSADFSRVVIVPNSEVDSPRIARRSVAHELGHGAIWIANPSLNEAAADYFGWLLSGLTRFERPESVLQQEMAYADGDRRVVEARIIRDLAKPQVRHVSELLPSLKDYHANGLLFASLFFEIDQRFGSGTSQSLLDFLEKQRSRIPYVTDPNLNDGNEEEFEDFIRRSFRKGEGVLGWVKLMIFRSENMRGVLHMMEIRKKLIGEPQDFIVVDSNNVEQVRAGIAQSFKRTGQLIREWIAHAPQSIDAKEVERMLDARGI